MVKKIFPLLLLLTLSWSCATHRPPPPSLEIGDLPPSLIAEFSLEERILAEDAWSNLKKGEVNKAEKMIAKLGEKNPLYHVGLGYAAYLLDKTQTAEEFFKAALKNYPDMVLIHSGLAHVYLKTGREDEAFTELREVLKREPDHPWAKQEYETLKNKKTEESLSEAKNALSQGDTEKSKRNINDVEVRLV